MAFGLSLVVLAAASAPTPARAEPTRATTPSTGAEDPAKVDLALRQAAEAQAQSQAQQQQQQTAFAAGDPYGFTAWLNSTRAGYGLGAVGYDPSLSDWASANNAQQQASGMGHYVMGSARRQNSAMGDYASIGAMWMNSPAHRAALLDPSISMIGIAGLGAYWTFNAY